MGQTLAMNSQRRKAQIGDLREALFCRHPEAPIRSTFCPDPQIAADAIPIACFSICREHQIPAHKRERGGVAKIHVRESADCYATDNGARGPVISSLKKLGLTWPILSASMGFHE